MKLDPEFADALYDLGMVTAAAKKYDEAEEIFQRCLTKGINRPFAAQSLAMIYEKRQEWINALENYSLALPEIHKLMFERIEVAKNNGVEYPNSDFSVVEIAFQGAHF